MGALSERLHDRLQWQPAGSIFDGPRRYLMMRPDVLMGAVVGLDPLARLNWLQAWSASTARHGDASLKAYAEHHPDDPQGLCDTVVQAAADLGWGRWHCHRHSDRIVLHVEDSPFAAGWHAAASEACAHAVCAPIQGMFSALARRLMPGALEVEECRCGAQTQEASICRFEARRGVM